LNAAREGEKERVRRKKRAIRTRRGFWERGYHRKREWETQGVSPAGHRGLLLEKKKKGGEKMRKSCIRVKKGLYVRAGEKKFLARKGGEK